MEKPNTPILDGIDSPDDVRVLSDGSLTILAKEIRDFMVWSVSQTGGHLSSSLGAVELAIALHAVFNTPDDKIIWDVGHQAYAHKMLTGRRDRMGTLRQYHGISGFPKRCESEYDAFGTAHSSTSISAALGMAVADALLGIKDRWHVAVIGDGALTGGMALEALNDAGVYKKGLKLLIILNDNDCSISPPVGALSSHLAKIVSTRTFMNARELSKKVLKPVPGLWEVAKRMEKQAINFVSPPSGIFSAYDLNYFGPVDGHNLPELLEVLRNLRKLDGPCVLHVVTKKGKGYPRAEADPTTYHGVGKFDPDLGILPSANPGKPTYTQVFGRWICDRAEKDPMLYGITPAMREGSGLVEFAKRFPIHCNVCYDQGAIIKLYKKQGKIGLHVPPAFFINYDLPFGCELSNIGSFLFLYGVGEFLAFFPTDLKSHCFKSCTVVARHLFHVAVYVTCPYQSLKCELQFHVPGRKLLFRLHPAYFIADGLSELLGCISA